MRKVKNVVISLLLVTVIAIGLSSAIFAAPPRYGYVYCTNAYGERVIDRIPYYHVFASYEGYGLTRQFRAKVTLKVNGGSDNGGSDLSAVGYYSWSSSSASLIYEPSYPDDSYDWNHYPEYEN